MVFRPNCTDETRERLAPYRGGGTWDDAINAVIMREGTLREENAQLRGQQSAVRDMAVSEADDLRQEIAAKGARIAELKAENARLRSEAVRLDEMVDDIREVAASQVARIAELEAMWVEERAARLWADDIFRYEGHLTWSEVDARTRSHCIEEARAGLGKDTPEEAP